MARPSFQHRRLGAKQVGDVAHPAFIAILRNAKTLFRLCDGGFRDLDALSGRAQIGIRAADLKPDGGAGTLLLGLALAQRERALLDARLVAEAVEQVPTHSDRDQPVGAPAVVEALPVRLEGGVDAHLRQKAAAHRGGTVFGQTGRESHLASLGPLAEGVLFVVRQQALGHVQRCQCGAQSVRRIERQAQRIVQGGARHIQIRRARDLLLADTGQVNADREHVHIGGHPGGPDGLGPLQVRLRRTRGLAGHIELLDSQ